MLKGITISLAALALVTSTASAAPKLLSDQQLDRVVAGCGCEPPPETEKGNNGWGNGADPSNPGSDHGATGPSKVNNNNLPPGQDRPNTNPTDSTGR